MKKIIVALGLLAFMSSCESDKPNQQGTTGTVIVEEPIKEVKVPTFSADSAYKYIQKQVDFGPRVPNTPQHAACADWIVSKLKETKAKVIVQEAVVKGPDLKDLPIKNIIASFNPEQEKRVLLCAHWDTRAIADYDRDESKRDQPILGADDGGSGVGVLLEVARVLNEHSINMGVDIILFDAEDQGTSSNVPGSIYRQNSWCLGAQYWSKNLHDPNYMADFGILLDMVGSKGARFPQEKESVEHANYYVQKVWGEAARLGYDNYFVPVIEREIIDDHIYVNEIANIPTMDVINLPTAANSRTGFGHYWHTHNDNMDVIDKYTLGVVGEVVLSVLYRRAENAL